MSTSVAGGRRWWVRRGGSGEKLLCWGVGRARVCTEPEEDHEYTLKNRAVRVVKWNTVRIDFDALHIINRKAQ